jgi:RHS repeat-associated protein
VLSAQVSIGTQYCYSTSPLGAFNLTSVTPGSYTLNIYRGYYSTFTRESLVTVVSGKGTDLGYLTIDPYTRSLPSSVSQASAVWSGTEALLFGGYASPLPLNQVLEYNPTQASSTVVPNVFSSGRTRTAAVWTGQYAYVFGGDLGDNLATKEVVRYSPSANTATVVYTKLPKAMYDTTAVWTGQYAYLIGGAYHTRTSFDTMDTIIKYDPVKNRATTMGARLPVTLSQCGAAYDGQYIYIFGGLGQYTGVHDTILRYDPASDTLVQLSVKLPVESLDVVALADSGKIYLYGVTGGGAVYVFDPATQSLTLMTRKHCLWYPPTSAIFDGYTTLLFSDNYVGRYHHRDLVQGTGVDGHSMFIGGMVNAANGNLVLTSDDMSFDVKGFSISFTRTYNSFLYSQLGPLGYGWTHSYNIYATAQQYGDVVITEGCGSKHLFIKEPNGYYQTPPGMSGRLTGTIAGGNLALWSPDGTKTSFDTSGKISGVVDKNGNSLQFVYQSGKLVNITDSSGLYMRFEYDTSNRIVRIYNVFGESVNYYYSTYTPITGCLREVGRLDASGQVYVPVEFIGYLTDGSRKLSSIRYNVDNRYVPSLGVVATIVDCTELVYDSSNRVTEVWKAEAAEMVYPDHLYPAVRKYKIDYLSSTLTRGTCSLGGTLDITKTIEGLPTAASGSPIVGGAACGSGGGSCGTGSLFPGIPGNQAATMTWSGEFQLLSWADAKANRQTTEYDGLGNVVAVTDASLNRTVYSYSLTASDTKLLVTLKSVTDALGYRTSYTYDTKGNLLRTIDAKNFYTENWYGLYGQVLQTRDKRGYNTTYEYDSHGFVTGVTSPLGFKTVIARNETGEITNMTTPLGYETDYEYENGEVVYVQYPDGTTVRYDRNPQGDVYQTYSAIGLPTYYMLNATLGTVDAITNELNYTTQYFYNSMGHLLKVLDAKGHAYTFTYDTYARLKTVTYPLGQVFELWYDAAGNVIKRKDANGNETQYTYDSLNRQTDIIYPNGERVVRTFDALGNVLNITGPSPGIWKETEYDYMGRPVEVTTHYVYSGYYTYFNHEFKELISYDAAGNPVSSTITDVTLSETVYDVEYDWSPVNQLSEMRTSTGGPSWEFWYDKDGRKTSMRASCDMIGPWYNTSYVYDSMSRIESISVATNGSLAISGYSYEYDDAGRIEVASDSGGTTTYEYDNIGQLVRYVMPDGNYTNYTYDSVGNRLKEVSVIDGVQTTVNYTYDANDRLLTVGSSSYQYDQNGNLIYKNIYLNGYYYPTTYAYDHENRLVSVDGGELETNNYSGDSELLVSYQYMKKGAYLDKLNVYSHAGSLSTRAHLRVMAPSDGHYYDSVTLYNVPGQDEFLGYEEGTDTLFFDGKWFAVVDAMGNTRALAQLADTTPSLELRSYSPFGEMSPGPSSMLDIWTVCPSFQGRHYDYWSEVYDFRARSYDPMTGRFAQVDPQASYGGSLYAFVDSDPLTGRDPTGEKMSKKCGEKFIMILIAVGLYALGLGMTAVDDCLESKKYSQLAADMLRIMGRIPSCVAKTSWSSKVSCWGGVLVDSFVTVFKFWKDNLVKGIFNKIKAGLRITGTMSTIWISMGLLVAYTLSMMVQWYGEGCHF